MTNESKPDGARRRVVAATGAVVVLVAVALLLWPAMTGGDSPTETPDPGANPDESHEDIFGLDTQPRLGDADAPVTVVEFGDFKCPHCATFEETVFQPLLSDYIEPGDVAFYFINFQFLAADSVTAGEAAEAVYAQDPEAFWTYYEALYQNQGPQGDTWATEDYLVQLAREVVPDIDHGAMAEALQTGEYRGRVEGDRAIGQRAGVQGTPAVFVEDRLMTEWFYEDLQAAIDAELGD